MLKRLINCFRREPDFIVGGKENPYLKRWHIIPQNRFFNIYLHQFLRDDDDRALHDHPWASCSVILKGGYLEALPADNAAKLTMKHRKPGRLYFRKASAAHRVVLFRHFYNQWDMIGEIIPAWTLFLTGPKIREWGFHCPKGWRHWRDFCDERDSGQVGKGCAD